MLFVLDSWSIAFYSTEIFVNLAFFPFCLLLGYICVTQKTFHPNFRFLIQVQNICNVIVALQRLILVITRFCKMDERLSLLLDIAFISLIFAGFLSIFSWAGLAIERVIALIFCERYEKHYAGWHIYLVFLLPSILLSTGIAVGFIFVSKVVSEEISGLGIVLLHTLLLTITAASFPIVLKCNKIAFERRHRQNLNMTTRYQLDENIRATRYILPIAFLVMFHKLSVSFILIYSVFFGNIRLGQDTTYIAHVYNLIGGIARLIVTSWLVIASGHFRWSFCKKNRAVEKSPRHLETDQYFKDLKKMWE